MSSAFCSRQLLLPPLVDGFRCLRSRLELLLSLMSRLELLLSLMSRLELLLVLVSKLELLHLSGVQA